MPEKTISECSGEELVQRTGATTIGTSSGMKAQEAQAELTRRLMNTIRSAEKTTSRHSKVMLGLTFILFIVAMLQLATAIFALNLEMWIRLVFFVGAGAFIAYAFWMIEKELLN